MKALIAVIVLLHLCVETSFAVEVPGELTKSVPKSALEVSLEDGWNDAFISLMEKLRESGGQIFREGLAGMVEVLVILFLAALAEAIFSSVKGKDGFNYVALAASAAIVLAATGDVDQLMGLGEQTILELEQFSKVLLPALAAATASMGYVGAAAMRQVTTVLVCDILLTLISRIILPLIYLYMTALAAASMLSDKRLDAIALWIKKSVVWLLGGLLTLFTLYLTIAGIVLGTVDAAAARTTRRAIAGAVPVVGGILSGTAEVILAGAGVLKNTIGVFGVLIVFATCAIPFLRLGVQYLLYKFSAFVASTVTDGEMIKLINGLGGVFGLMLGTVGSCAVVLLVSLISSLLVVAA